MKKRQFTHNQWNNITTITLLPIGEDKNLVINTSQRHYEYHIDATIKASQMARKEKQVYIYSNTLGPEELQIFYRIYSHILLSSLPFLSFGYLTLSSEAYGKHHTGDHYLFQPYFIFSGSLNPWTTLSLDNHSN